MRWDLTRRAMVAGGMALAGLIMMGRKPAAAENALLASLGDRGAAARIGKAAWTGLGEGRALAVQILDDLHMDAATAANMAPAEMRKHLSRRIQSDFAAGRTLKLDGWLVALTEARLCALAARRELA